MPHTPYFPAWRPRLANLGRRLESFARQPFLHLEKVFAPLLPPGLFSQRDEGPNSRRRLYSLSNTFWAFLYQAFDPGCSCREAVSQILTHLGLHNLRPEEADPKNSAYCTARKRLPLEVLQGAREAAAQQAQNRVPTDQSRWRGHDVKVVDGTTLLMADRGFGNYVLLALLMVFCQARAVFRLHAARQADFRQGKKLGPGDALFTWSRPCTKPRWLPQSLWRRVPDQLTVRVVQVSLHRPGFRAHSVTLVTTLLDAQAYPALELARLYLRRWRIELWFRHIKTTMGMEYLRCHSPAMVQKELETYLIAYNLIRCVMAEAALVHHGDLERISFKGAVDRVRQYSIVLAQAPTQKKRRQLVAMLLSDLARDAGRS